MFSRILDEFRQDLTQAWRMVAHNPRFAALVILTLALGIGANTAVFSVFDAVLLRPLPFKDAGRLIAIWESDPKKLDSTGIWNSYRDFRSWRERSGTVEEFAAYSWYDAEVRGHGAPRTVLAPVVTPNFFSLLGVRAADGRTLVPADKLGDPLVVLGHRFSIEHFGTAAGVAGRTIVLDRKPWTVIGVMPADFEFYPKEAGMWRLMTPDAEFIRDPNNHRLVVFGRMRRSVPIESVQAELTAIRADINRGDQDDVSEFVPVVHTLQEDFTWLTGRNLSRTLFLLLGAVGLLLLIACLNIANLLLTRGVQRHKEIAVRSALGAGRGRLLRLLLAEALVLAGFGTALGIVLALAALRYFLAANPVALPPGNAVRIDLRILAFSVLLGVITTLLSGLIPAWRASKTDLHEALKDAARGSSMGGLHSGAARLMAVLEVSLSLVLLAGAGLMIQSVRRMANTPLGFRPDRLLTMSVHLPKEGYSQSDRAHQFFDRLTQRIRGLRGVEGAELSTNGPLASWGSETVEVDGEPSPPPDVIVYGDVGRRAVSPGYFRLAGIPLLAGRNFEVRDGAGTEPVAIVNESFVRKHFQHGEPIGRHVRAGFPPDKHPWLRVVGVVGNTKGPTVFREMALVTSPLLFRPVAQAPENDLEVIVRAAVESRGLHGEIPRQVTALDPDLPVYDVKTVSDAIAQDLKYPKFRANILSLFAGLALLLATVGIYGVVSQIVVSRTREIGIRVALGATRESILRMVARQGILLAGTGAAIGLLASFALMRTLASMLYEVRPGDPLTLFAVTAALVVVAVIASWIPARRAARLDPLAAIRHE